VSFKRRHEKLNEKEKELEGKITSKYGAKALKMLQKSGGFKIG
jgi:hypothetical protein